MELKIRRWFSIAMHIHLLQKLQWLYLLLHMTVTVLLISLNDNSDLCRYQQSAPSTDSLPSLITYLLLLHVT